MEGHSRTHSWRPPRASAAPEFSGRVWGGELSFLGATEGGQPYGEEATEEEAMENRFDELAKAVAGGMSRREVLSRVGRVLAGGVLALMGMKAASAQPPECPPGEHFSGCGDGTFMCCPIGTHCTPSGPAVCSQGPPGHP
jgi:hypothetical protein